MERGILGDFNISWSRYVILATAQAAWNALKSKSGMMDPARWKIFNQIRAEGGVAVAMEPIFGVMDPKMLSSFEFHCGLGKSKRRFSALPS
jgi:hypothetical protein